MQKINPARAGRRRSTNINENGLIWGLAIIKLVIILIAANHYHYNPQELYYLACSHHPSWGYADVPPFSILLLWLVRNTIGTSIYALHILPALSGALTVFFIGHITRELGGSRFAITLASTAYILTPLYLSIHSSFSPAAFDGLFYILVLYFFIKSIHTENYLYWFLIGFFMGLAVLNAFSSMGLILGLFAGLLFKKYRNAFLHKEVWYAALLVICALLPHITWQLDHSLPINHWFSNHSVWSSSNSSLAGFFSKQFLFNNLFVIPVYIAGIIAFFKSKALKEYSIFQFIFITVVVLHLIAGTNDGTSLFSAYPLLLIPGAIFMEETLVENLGNSFKLIILIPIMLFGLLLLPFSSPVLPIIGLKIYQQNISEYLPLLTPLYISHHTLEYGAQLDTDQKIKEIHSFIKKQEPGYYKCIITDNSQLAAAIDFYHVKYQFPSVISPHSVYGYWGPGNIETSRCLYIDTKDIQVQWRDLFNTIVLIDTVTISPDFASQSRLFFFECKDINKPIENAWPALLHTD